MALLELNVKAKPTVVTPPPSPNPSGSYLPLQEGKKYVLKNGTVIGPMMELGAERMKWLGPLSAGGMVAPWSWRTQTGLFVYHEGNEEYEYHIVAEYDDNPILSHSEFINLWMKGVPMVYKSQATGKGWYHLPACNIYFSNPTLEKVQQLVAVHWSSFQFKKKVV